VACRLPMRRMSNLTENEPSKVNLNKILKSAV
jgi:hypothetical protein